MVIYSDSHTSADPGPYVGGRDERRLICTLKPNGRFFVVSLTIIKKSWGAIALSMSRSYHLTGEYDIKNIPVF